MNKFQKSALFLTRMAAGWYFFHAGITKVLNPEWSAAGYLSNAKTFPDFYLRLTQPDILPAINFINQWALTLLGAALILGVAVRLASWGGMLLMLLYYFPILQFPIVGARAYLVDEHILYSMMLLVLSAFSAGRVWGLEQWFSQLPFINQLPKYKKWIG